MYVSPMSTVAACATVLPLKQVSRSLYRVAVFPVKAGATAKNLYIADTGHKRIRRVTLQ